MTGSRSRLPMISSVLALLAVAAAWGATFTDRPWDIVLIIVAIVSISVTTGTLGYWISRTRAETRGE